MIIQFNNWVAYLLDCSEANRKPKTTRLGEAILRSQFILGTFIMNLNMVSNNYYIIHLK